MAELSGSSGERGGLVAIVEFNADAFKLRAHRRVDIGVGTTDLMPRLACQLRETCHEGAADAENVNFQGKSQITVSWKIIK